jgi:hypothetical protein
MIRMETQVDDTLMRAAETLALVREIRSSLAAAGRVPELLWRR